MKFFLIALTFLAVALSSCEVLYCPYAYTPNGEKILKGPYTLIGSDVEKEPDYNSIRFGDITIATEFKDYYISNADLNERSNIPGQTNGKTIVIQVKHDNYLLDDNEYMLFVFGTPYVNSYPYEGEGEKSTMARIRLDFSTSGLDEAGGKVIDARNEDRDYGIDEKVIYNEGINSRVVTYKVNLDLSKRYHERCKVHLIKMNGHNVSDPYRYLERPSGQ